jgi:glutamate/tyrosine decarboxylase-like PLP-dependent enzyme
MFFIPFLNKEDYENIGEPIFSFYKEEKSKLEKLSFPHVNSISVDLHKMGLIPYPAGVILINKEDGWTYIQRKADYIAGHYDATLSGSRSGAAVVSAYAAIKELGFDGYKSIMCNCLRLTNKFLELFKMFDDVFEIVGRPITNVFAIRFKKTFLEEIKKNTKLEKIVEYYWWLKRCVKNYIIVTTSLIKNNDEKGSGKSDEVKNIENKIFRFVIMPHVTDEVFENFVNNVSNFMQEVRNVR